MSKAYPVLDDTPEYSAMDDDLHSDLTHTETSFVKINEGEDVETILPCPWCEAMFGTTFVYQCCCCCFWNENDRRNCAIGVLYSKVYLLLYVTIIVITITLVVFDFTQGFDTLQHEEPSWFVGLDIVCVSLMVVDVFVQILANPLTYWKSAANVFDFSVVAICVIGVPIYFYVPQSDIILTIVLLLRFAAQLLRIIMIFRHQKQRRAYIDATRNDIVDFSRFQDSVDIAKNQGIADDGRVYTNDVFDSGGPMDTDLSKNIREMTPEWTVIDSTDIPTIHTNNTGPIKHKNVTPVRTPRDMNKTNNGTIYPTLNLLDTNNNHNDNMESDNSNNSNLNNENIENHHDENQSLTGQHQKGYESFSDVEKDKEATNSLQSDSIVNENVDIDNNLSQNNDTNNET